MDSLFCKSRTFGLSSHPLHLSLSLCSLQNFFPAIRVVQTTAGRMHQRTTRSEYSGFWFVGPTEILQNKVIRRSFRTFLRAG